MNQYTERGESFVDHVRFYAVLKTDCELYLRLCAAIHKCKRIPLSTSKINNTKKSGENKFEAQLTAHSEQTECGTKAV